ncbi:MAG: sulfite exporter TauE/SafE family protein [Pseudomonadota bacterium]
MTLLPASVALWEAGALVALSVFTSLITAALGIGGGVLMLAAMAQVVPVAALIPLHGVVQLGSNVSRMVLQIRSASWTVLAPFIAGSAVGAVAGGALVRDVPDGILLLAIGAFVIVSTFVKVPPLGGGQWAVMTGGGFIGTLATMFVGATGPFTVALFRPARLAHKALVASLGVAMAMQHVLKTIAFGLLGFAFSPWLPLLVLMIIAGFLGTVIGTRLLNTLPEAWLRQALNIVLTLLGLQLMARGALILL